MADKWIETEREHNRVPPEGYEGYHGQTCKFCGVERIDSIFLHRHVCPDIPEHRDNYNTDYLERELLGS